MLSKHQAYLEAKAILSKAKLARRPRFSNPLSLYNHRDLRALGPTQRLEVIQQAKNNYRKSPLPILAMGTLAIFALVLLAATPHPSPFLYIAQSLGLSIYGPFTIFWIRREAVKLANALRED